MLGFANWLEGRAEVLRRRLAVPLDAMHVLRESRPQHGTHTAFAHGPISRTLSTVISTGQRGPRGGGGVWALHYCFSSGW